MLRFIDSFDHFATADAPKKGWTLGALATISANGRNSTSGLRCTTNNLTHSAIGQLVVPAVSGATAVVGFAFRADTSTRAKTFPLLAIVNGSTTNITVSLTTTGALSIVRGPDDGFGTLIATSSAVITNGTWHYIETKVLFDNAAGTYEVRVDGVNVLSATGVDTIDSGSAAWTGIYLRPVSIGDNAPNQPTFDFDDLYVCDGSGGVEDDFLGDHRVVCVIASAGNGSNTDWTPSTGTDHGALVDEATPNDSDYVQSGTAGQRDTFAFAALGVAGTVKALQHVNYLKAQASGVRYVGEVARIGGANYDAAGQSVGSDWEYQTLIQRVSPATSAAWTTAEIDGAEFGVKVTA